MARKLEIEIVGDASSLKRALGQADKGFKGSIGQWVKGGLVLGGVQKATELLSGAISGGISEWKESTKVTAQTNAVLKSTGRAANVTADHVDDLADSLMKKSGVDDEAIKSGENLLLTFTNIRNEAGKGNKIFDDATKAALDLSVATGKDLAGANVLVGKALNDPIKGLTALTRVGVSFTEGQKKQIKALVDSGHPMKAQKIILGELNKEFGGSAEAAGKTLPGQIDILKQRFANFSGELVAKTIPILQKAIAWLKDHWPEIRAALEDFWASAKPLLKAFGDYIGTVVGLFRKHWGTIGPILNQVLGIIKTVMKQIENIFKLVTAILKGDWSAAWDAIKAILRTALDMLLRILRLWKDTVLSAMAAIGKAILTGIWNGIKDAAGWLKDKITGLFHDAIDWVKDVLGIKSPSSVFAEIGKNMIRGMVGGIGSMGGYLKDAVVKLAKSVPGRVLGAVRGNTPGAPNMGGLDPRVANAVIVAGQRGWKGSVTSGFRSRAEQTALYARYLAGGPLAARPGTSSHERGEAVDVTDYQTFGRIMAQLPSSMRLYNRLGAVDPVHYSVSGYAKGGIFNKPTLGVIGEAGPEAVIPLSRGRGAPVQVNLQIDGRTLASVLFDPLRNKVSQHRRGGGVF